MIMKIENKDLSRNRKIRNERRMNIDDKTNSKLYKIKTKEKEK